MFAQHLWLHLMHSVSFDRPFAIWMPPVSIADSLVSYVYSDSIATNTLETILNRSNICNEIPNQLIFWYEPIHASYRENSLMCRRHHILLNWREKFRLRHITATPNLSIRSIRSRLFSLFDYCFNCGICRFLEREQQKTSVCILTIHSYHVIQFLTGRAESWYFFNLLLYNSRRIFFSFSVHWASTGKCLIKSFSSDANNISCWINASNASVQ